MKKMHHFDKEGVHLSGWMDKTMEEFPVKTTLHLESEKLNEALKAYKKYPIRKIRITPNTYKLQNLDILKSPIFSNLKSFSNGFCEINDYSPIENLSTLEELVISIDKNYSFDFMYLENLTYLYLHWTKNLKSIDNLSRLKTLKINKFKGIDLSIFSNLKSLELLETTNGTHSSLKGIENIHGIKKIDIDSARNLESLNGLNETHSKLEHIRLYSVPNLKNADALSKLPNLKSLSITRFKKLDSLGFIDNLNKCVSIVIRPIKGKEQTYIRIKDESM